MICINVASKMVVLLELHSTMLDVKTKKKKKVLIPILCVACG